MAPPNDSSSSDRTSPLASKVNDVVSAKDKGTQDENRKCKTEQDQRDPLPETYTSGKLDEDDNNNDQDLFAPDPPKDECPLCLMPMQVDRDAKTYYPCCGKSICDGCVYFSVDVCLRDMKEMCVTSQSKREEVAALQERLVRYATEEDRCPFCRDIITPGNTSGLKRALKKRMDANNADAFHAMGYFLGHGEHGFTQDRVKAMKYFLKAAQLGSVEAAYDAAKWFRDGEGVERDPHKAKRYLKMAAKGGHEEARYDLGKLEDDAGNLELAMKHWMISASAGHDESLKHINRGYRAEALTKLEYAQTLRAYQNSREAETSDERTKYKTAQLDKFQQRSNNLM